jgi:hypothetical protein
VNNREEIRNVVGYIVGTAVGKAAASNTMKVKAKKLPEYDQA